MSQKSAKEDRGLLSGAHHPLLVVGFFLAAMGGLGLLALSTLYRFDNPSLDLQRHTADAAVKVMVFGTAGVFAAALFAALMRKFALAAAVFLIPVALAGSWLGWRLKEVIPRLKEQEAKIADSEAKEQRRQENLIKSQKLREDLDGFCADPKPLKKAAKYDKGDRDPHPLLFLSKGWSSNPPEKDYFMGQWEATRLKDVQLIACLTRQSKIIDRCSYEGGMSLSRTLNPVDVVIFEARTGQQLLAQSIAPEGTPAPCPYAITYKDASVHSAEIPRDALPAFLKPLHKGKPRAKKKKKKKKI